MKLQNIRRAIVSLVWVVAAFAVYTVAVVPWIDLHAFHDPDVATDETPSLASTSTDRYVRELQPYFPAGSWELEEPKVLRSDQAMVLMKEVEQLDDGSLRVRPCTMILFGNTSADGSVKRGPTILQAPEGAELSFDKKFDLRREIVDAKPTGGRLVGPIRIVNAGSVEAEDFELVTRDVMITGQRAWTSQKVTFRWGQNYGVGYDLMLTIAPDTPATPTAGASTKSLLAGISSIEVQRLEQLTLQLGSGDLFDSLSPNDPSQVVAPSGPPSLQTVDVRCAGPLRFDLQQLIATVEKDVRISRQLGAGPADTIQATKLSMHMKYVPLPTEPTVQDGADPVTDPKAQAKQRLALSRVVATGEPLVIDARSRSAYVESSRLEYDLLTGQIKLQGLNPFATRPADRTTSVFLQTPEHQIYSPSIDFVGGDDQSRWRMVANGPGEYRGKPQADAAPVAASWSQQLLLQPDGDQQVLRVVGDAVVQADQFGSVEASIIELWMETQRTVVAHRLDGSQVVETKTIPRQLVTQTDPQVAGGAQKCRINTEQLRGTLAKMTVIFTPDDPHQATDRGNSAPRPGDDPFVMPAGSPSASNSARSASRTYRIDGGELVAWVNPSQQELQGIQLRGPSKLMQWDAVSGEAFEIVGTSVDYATGPRGEPMAVIEGTPATVTSATMRLNGARIELNGSANRMIVPGAGTLRVEVPRAMLSAGAAPIQATNAADQFAPAADATSPMDVSWQGSLVFDGRDIRLQDQVLVQSDEFQIRTARLRIVLDRAVDLNKLQGQHESPQLQNIVAEQGVIASSWQRNEQGENRSLYQIATRDLQLDYVSGATTARGPGWLAVTSRGALIGAKSQNRNPPAAATESQLSQLSIAFSQELTGNLHRREAQLVDDVRTWFGPVENWEERVDPVPARQLRDQDIRMTCRELVVLESPTATRSVATSSGGRRPIELLARGGTHVESRQYEALAEQIKYAEEKDMLILEGDTSRPAQLWRRNPRGGAPTQSGQARKITFWPRSEEILVDDLIGADITQPMAKNPGDQRQR